MIFWAAVCGAIFGWALRDFGNLGLLLGAMLGAFAGWIGKRALRAEVAAATALLNGRIDELQAMLRDGSFETSPTGLVNVERVPEAVPTAQPAAAPAVPTPVPEPQTPTVARFEPVPPGRFEQALSAGIAAVRSWLFGGNTIVRVGLILLFVGLSFLASYAASAGLFPIELRLALVGAVGVALLLVGFRTRLSRPGFGLALQGGGVATVYLTLFGAARVYDVLPVAAAFALMILVSALGCALALLQRSQALAVTAFAGGFAVPLLLGGQGGPIAAVWAYYTILNLAILFIARARAWRGLNLLGFLATFGVTAAWWWARYTPADFAEAQAFVVASVLIYLAAGLLYTRATPGRAGNVVDTTLLFGPALAGFGLEVALLHHQPFGSAFAALGFGALYLGVAAFTARRRPESHRVMSEALLAIGVGFVTLAVPLALGARWTSAAWALEGAGAFWVGARQQRWVPRLFGVALEVVAGLIYLSGWAAFGIWDPARADALFVGGLLVAVAFLLTAWLLRARPMQGDSRWAVLHAGVEARLEKPVFLAGFLCWWMAWASETLRQRPAVDGWERVLPGNLPDLLQLLAFLLSTWGAQAIGRRRDWPVAAWPSRVSLFALAWTFLRVVARQPWHALPTLWSDWLIWAVAIVLHFHMLRRNDAEDEAKRPAGLLRVAHVGGVWLAVLMLADQLGIFIDLAGLGDTSWAEVILLASTVAPLIALSLWTGPGLSARKTARGWPLDRHALDYGWRAAVPMAALVLVGGALTACVASGDTAPLPYLPLLNPVDLSLALALAALMLWRRTMLLAIPAPAGAAVLRGWAASAAGGAFALLAVSTAWLRVAHQLLGIAWDPDALLASAVVETGLAIGWTLVALGLMVWAHRRARRAVWLVGAGLLGVTVVKLLLVDLGTAGGAARIVAFIGVGLLMLVLGYLAPLPPRAAARETEAGA